MEEDIIIFNKDDEKIDWTKRKRIYALFIYVCVFLNYDTGVVPASLNQIKKELKFNYSEIAGIG